MQYELQELIYHALQIVVSHLQTSHGLSGSAAGLKNAYHAHFFRLAILTDKVGETETVFGMQPGFISRSVHARLQVSVCSGYDLCHPC